MRTLEQLCHNYLRKIAADRRPRHQDRTQYPLRESARGGADRIVNSVAGIEKYGTPLIVVDFGTATTFDYIDADNNYLGGAIVPGIGISTEALYQRAAKLPRIELVRPKSVVGRNPVTSMQAGIIFGYAGQVDGIVQRIRKEFGVNAARNRDWRPRRFDRGRVGDDRGSGPIADARRAANDLRT